MNAFTCEKEKQLKKLHAYSSHNAKLVASSERCYCFYCRSEFESSEISAYVDEGETVLCPRCNIDAVIPDAIDESLDADIIEEMNKYWF